MFTLNPGEPLNHCNDIYDYPMLSNICRHVHTYTHTNTHM